MACASSSAGAGSSTDNESDGEEQEPSLSTSILDTAEALEDCHIDDRAKNNASDELEAFRQQWQQELGATSSPRRDKPNPTSPQRDITDTPKQDTSPSPTLESEVPASPQDSKPPVQAEDITDEEKAKQLFRGGVELERSGKLYEAIQHYKRAMQILPDVETRLYDNERPESPEVESETEEVPRNENAGSEDEEYIEGEELAARLQRLLAGRGAVCEPLAPVKGMHLSQLPYEVLLVVMRWVVGAELDAGSLERAARVCRGLYLLAREPALWRDMCLRTWGAECGSPRALGFPCWRQMFVSRPRLLLHGCYISKTTYLRHGENSFQDQFYRPWYLVDYYRYLRFFPEGAVLLWTTPEEPAACVPHLRTRSPRAGLGVLRGHYRLLGDQVVIIAKKEADKKATLSTNTRFRSRRKETHEHHDTTFHLEFQLRSVRGRRNWQLAWRGYSVAARRDQCTHFELGAGKFPPLAFSPVRSYTAEAAAPL